MPGRPTKRLPGDLPTKKVLRAFYRLGFTLAREGGSHTVLMDPNDRSRVAVIPRHTQVKQGLLRAILRDVGLSEEEFLSAY